MNPSFTSRPLSGARKPVRKHAQERFDTLLDATESLLADTANEDVSLAQIADIAGVPLASVYHFFPNRNAAFVALAQRFHAELRARAQQRQDPAPTSWQEHLAHTQRRATSYLNGRPAALRLFMGAGVSVQVRNIDMEGNARISRRRAEEFSIYFDMPRIPELENRMATVLAMSDGIWALSYSIHGRITDAFVDESIRASVCYLRCFLPEIIPPAPAPV
ncbi:transcriptional regulator, TetR family [Tardiphaga sp. OK246]|jgi:AcrR family transcriptional regulator|uniref:TetR/AcrR family transcriptional regulator n=1 Tax=Tardiphaga sp. OK246 TaxID=1855307 RepID=UPI000B6E375D|nr:TetR/AcrR family transcriptional regulator [Tardiphaga sp. OK246]SNS45683.1 transcriptional regulator, TetR family [Tardiphaga sp. OK246]